jgi:hypothetical protein
VNNSGSEASPSGPSGGAQRQATTDLFRAVSDAELRDLHRSGAFRPVRGYYEGKLFATSAQDAAYYGRVILYPIDKQPITLVKATVPQSFRDQLIEFESDGRMTVAVDRDQLAEFNQQAEIMVLPDVPIPMSQEQASPGATSAMSEEQISPDDRGGQ